MKDRYKSDSHDNRFCYLQLLLKVIYLCQAKEMKWFMK